MEKIRLLSVEEELFEKCWQLYVNAFPEVERRARDYQLLTLEREDYHFDVFVEDDNFLGFVAWWDFENLRYIEHFATNETLRGRGLGAKILSSFASDDEKPIILEVEHPTDEMSRRRIGFYERLGFVLSSLDYAHPSYSLFDEDYVSLKIMSYPRPISAEDLQAFKENNFKMIHFLKVNIN